MRPPPGCCVISPTGPTWCSSRCRPVPSMECSTTVISSRAYRSKRTWRVCYPARLSNPFPRTTRGPLVRSTPSVVSVLDGPIRETLASGRTALTSGVWLGRHYGGFRQTLRRVRPDMSELTPVRLTAWRRGVRYFHLGLTAGERCFVKTDGRARLLEREVAAGEGLEGSPRARDCTPRLLFHEPGGPYPLAAFRLVDPLP